MVGSAELRPRTYVNLTMIEKSENGWLCKVYTSREPAVEAAEVESDAILPSCCCSGDVLFAESAPRGG